MASEPPVWIIGRHGQVAHALGVAARQRGLAYLHLSRPLIDFDRPHLLKERLAELKKTEGRPRIIINAAAYTAVDLAESNQDAALRINAESPERLAEFCTESDIALAHISTDYVFGGDVSRPLLETAPTEPVNFYGVSKLAGERAILASGARAFILRTAGVFSAHGSNFVKAMLRLASTRERVEVVDDQISSPTPADAIADCLLDIANTRDPGVTAQGLYHFSGDTALSWADFARRVFDRSHAQGGPACVVVPIASKDFHAKARRPAFSALDCRLIHREFGLDRPSLQAGIDRTLLQLMHSNR